MQQNRQNTLHKEGRKWYAKETTRFLVTFLKITTPKLKNHL